MGQAALAYHANVYLPAPAPSGSWPVGEEIGIVYAVTVADFPSWSPPGFVVIPNALFQIQALAGPTQFYLPAVNFTIHNAGTIEAPAGPLIRDTVAQRIPINQTALLSTQGLAVTASWPLGLYNVGIRWHWNLVAPNGGQTNGTWSPWGNVSPGRILNIIGTVPKSWNDFTPLQLCIGGSIGGRTFSVHLATGANGSQVDLGAATVPLQTPIPYCWTTMLNVTLVPQTAFIHLWEYGNVSFLLYVIKIQILNGTAASPSGSSTAPPGPYPMAAIPSVEAGIAVLVIVAICVILLRRSRGKSREPPRDLSAAGSASAPPPPPPSTPR
jgi:hypothetical protein